MCVCVGAYIGQCADICKIVMEWFLVPVGVRFLASCFDGAGTCEMLLLPIGVLSEEDCSR